jgi:hypothetical protein
MCRLFAAALTLAFVVSAVLTSGATAANLGVPRPVSANDHCPAGHVVAAENHRKPCGKNTNGQTIICPQTLAVLPAVASCRVEDRPEARGSTVESHPDSSLADDQFRPPKA